MKTKIRQGCVTLVIENLRISYYYCHLPIPKEVAEKLQFADCQFIKNKWFFSKTSANLDELWYHINLIQVTVNDYKVTLYEQKKLDALSRCVDFKTKQ